MKTNTITLEEFERKANENIAKVSAKIATFTIAGWVFVAAGILSLLLLVFPVNSGLKLNEVGDYVSGVAASSWSLAGIFFIYVAFLGQQKQMMLQEIELKYTREDLIGNRAELRGQKEQMELQNASIRKQNFDNSFFNLMDVHLSNVDSFEIVEMTIKPDRSKTPNYFRGRRGIRKVFFRIVKDIKEDESKTEINDGYLKNVNDSMILHHNYFRTISRILDFIEQSELESKDKEIYFDHLESILTNPELTFCYLYFKGESESFKSLWFEKRLQVTLDEYVNSIN